MACALYPRTPSRRHRVKKPHPSYAARPCEHTVRLESQSANPPANQPHPDKRHFTALFTTRDCFQFVAQSCAEICAATAQAVPHPVEVCFSGHVSVVGNLGWENKKQDQNAHDSDADFESVCEKCSGGFVCASVPV